MYYINKGVNLLINIDKLINISISWEDKIYLLTLVCVVLAIEIAPEPISKINPIVNTTKKIKAILNPKVLTLYKVTAIGNNNNISKSNIKNNISTT